MRGADCVEASCPPVTAKLGSRAAVSVTPLGRELQLPRERAWHNKQQQRRSRQQGTGMVPTGAEHNRLQQAKAGYKIPTCCVRLSWAVIASGGWTIPMRPRAHRSSELSEPALDADKALDTCPAIKTTDMQVTLGIPLSRNAGC